LIAPLSCVPYVVSFSWLSTFDCPFVLCTLCCQFLWIVHFDCPFVLCTLCCQFLWIAPCSNVYLNHQSFTTAYLWHLEIHLVYLLVVMGISHIFKIDDRYTSIDKWSIIGDNYLRNVFTDYNYSNSLISIASLTKRDRVEWNCIIYTDYNYFHLQWWLVI
jgi:hypothetical protein